MAVGLPWLSSWDNAALENTTRDSYVMRHTDFQLRLGKHFSPLQLITQARCKRKVNPVEPSMDAKIIYL